MIKVVIVVVVTTIININNSINSAYKSCTHKKGSNGTPPHPYAVIQFLFIPLFIENMVEDGRVE